VTPPSLSILIVNWNVQDYLKKCLDSIYQNPPRSSFEIIVVDNASQDQSVAMLRADYPEVKIIAHPANLGFAAGNNLALENASGQYVLLLNPDTLVFPQTIDLLVQALEANPRLAACGSRYLNPDQSLQASCYPLPTLQREFWRMFHLDRIVPLGRYDMRAWDQDAPREVEVLQGASLLLRRAVLEQVGFLDPAYFMYTEEVDLCYRIQKAGWKLAYVPRSVIIHYGGQSTNQIAAAMFLHLYKSKIHFFRKHFGAGAVWIYKSILALASIMRLVGLPFQWLFQKSQRPAINALWQNYASLLKSLRKM
jgi:GT2 family glycosyltransferase